ncbi:MAG TPA: signal peptidase I [Bacillota bacterium]|nr:signal peptidase I [Bacillota bacterium]
MKQRSWGGAIWETVETVVIALALALLIRGFVIESFVVQGQSMEPTLQNGEHLLVNKFIYRLQEPKAGQIIVFRPPLPTTRDFIKRVIALPGQRVSMRDGAVYIDGVLQPQTYLPPGAAGVANYPPTLVPAGDLFVLGDNRNNSEDSRYFGFVPIANVRGQAIVVWWPPQVAGSIH